MARTHPMLQKLTSCLLLIVYCLLCTVISIYCSCWRINGWSFPIEIERFVGINRSSYQLWKTILVIASLEFQKITSWFLSFMESNLSETLPLGERDIPTLHFAPRGLWLQIIPRVRDEVGSQRCLAFSGRLQQKTSISDILRHSVYKQAYGLFDYINPSNDLKMNTIYGKLKSWPAKDVFMLLKTKHRSLRNSISKQMKYNPQQLERQL